MKHQSVLVVDFGGQYSQLIVRRIREHNVFSEMVPWDHAESKIKEMRPDAIVLSGGPKSVIGESAPTLDPGVLNGIPCLGICYGCQWLAHHFGGKVAKAHSAEYGERQIRVVEPSQILKPLGERRVWMSHWDQVVAAPEGAVVTAETDSCPIAAFENPTQKLFGVQFHPEVSHTEGGSDLLRRFLFDVVGLEGDWNASSFIEDTLARIRDEVKDDHVLCAVSGGVDSSVVAALMTEALGSKVTCVFVDHGLLRLNEAEQVIEQFTHHFHPKLIAISARDRFLSELNGITDPEEKRKRIGAQFVKEFEAHADQLKDCQWLAQGTLYPDVIESGSSTAAKIKTHHNVGGLPDWMRLKTIEPLRWLFKDEVRAVGRALGLPAEMIEREPFPGPGLAVRILGEVTSEKVDITQKADAIFREEIRKHSFHRKGIWQSYAALLDVRSVGVMGDERTYERPIVLRAVQSEDAMTADAFPFPFEFLQHVAHRIVNEVQGVNRVLYDLTSKPPATIEWE